ncbi:phage tail tape measure protein [Paenibacillus sp. M1]|uniref:Phage tail tape measure protein n=1 Tax=Paenibacillus haidiansis TaxID=1574488 RepID=A0ABU7VS22_9BACL
MSLDSVFRLSVIVGMIDQLTGPMSRISSTVDGSVSRIDRLNQSFGSMTKTGLVMTGLGAQITNTALAPVEATFETQRALGELKSVGVKDLQALEQASENFSDTWAGTSKAQFISAAYDIKSGIASLNDEAVAKYTEMAGITAKGTKATIAEMTSLFATGYGIYKGFYKDMSDIDFGEMFAAGIGHAANIFKTDGPQMAQAISSLGAAATSAKVPMEEQFAILGMLQATMSGSEAGTKYRAFLQSAARAGDTLKLKFTDANNQLLSLPQILDKLRGKFGDTLDAAEKMQIQKAFGTDEAVAMVDLMYNKTGDLQDGILSLYDSMGKGISEVKEMANAINDTSPDRWDLLQQKIHNIGEDVGNMLLPTFNAFIDRGEQVVSRVSNWIDSHQQLTKYIALTILTIGILLTSIGTLVTLIGGVGLIFTKAGGIIMGFKTVLRAIPDMFTTLRIVALYAGDGIKAFGKGVLSAARALPGMIASVWSFTAALLANPVTWIVIGIVALIAAIILLWTNWDRVTSWIKSAWNSAINGIVAGFNWIKNLFAGMPVWLQVAIAAFLPFIGIPMLIINNWGSIRAFFVNLWNNVTGLFRNGIQAAKNVITGALTWFRESGSKVITTFTDGIKSVINKPVEMVKNGLAKVRELLPFSDAHTGPLSQLTLSGRRVFETIGTGMEQSQDIPAEMTDKAFGQMGLGRDGEVKKINLREAFTEKSESNNTTTEKESGLYIHTLNINPDISKMKDLPLLFALLKEIEDYNNGNGPTPAPAG